MLVFYNRITGYSIANFTGAHKMGLNSTEKFYPFYHDMLSETDKEEIELYAQASMLEELNRFFMHPDRPVILSLCCSDKRKNIVGLIKAYGEDLEL